MRDFATQNLGFMATRVDRPYLDRVATVYGIDHNWRPTQRWNVRTRLLGSDIDQAGLGTRDTGATMWADYEMDHGWRQQLLAMHFGNDLQLNDAGFLSRNSTNYMHWQVNRRFSNLPETSRYASKDWRLRLSSDYNDHGQLGNHQLRVSRESRLRNGAYQYAQINVNSAGYEDLLTRGNGVLWMPPNFNSYFEYDRPRKGNWAWHMELGAQTGGLAGNRDLGFTARFVPTYFVSDAFNVFFGAYTDSIPSWLIWQGGNLIGSFAEREVSINAGLNWTVGSKQELRVKLQAIGVKGRLDQGYRVEPGGRAVESSDPIDDIDVRTLGFQIRYRYELAPLSYIYVVYGRGGFDQEPTEQGASRLFTDTFRLRDDEQLLVKVSYRFDH